MTNIGPVKLTEVASSVEAAVITGALEEQGIESFTTGDFIDGFGAEAPSFVRVLVKPSDLDAAKAVLAEAYDEIEDVDWSKVDVGEPE